MKIGLYEKMVIEAGAELQEAIPEEVRKTAWAYSHHSGGDFVDYVHYPTQGELWDMIKIVDWLNAIGLVKNKDGYSLEYIDQDRVNPLCVLLEESITPEPCLLQAVMFHQFGKKWNGDKWVAEGGE